MILDVDGHPASAYTGGRAFQPGLPTVVFIHGVLNDHSVWGLQSRYLAHHGFNVMAVDLPGHGRSGGEPPRSVEEAAAFVLALLDAAGIEQAALVGHSFGSLTALEATARAPQRVRQLALLGTAFPMKVSPALLEAAQHDPYRAIEITNTYSHSMLAPPPSGLGPGTWVPGLSRALMRRVLESNPNANVAWTGFKACDDYLGGEAAMQAVTCPTLFIVGERDAMTTPRAAQLLQSRAKNARMVRVDAGHSMMAEAPDAVLDALKGFLIP